MQMQSLRPPTATSCMQKHVIYDVYIVKICPAVFIDLRTGEFDLRYFTFETASRRNYVMPISGQGGELKVRLNNDNDAGKDQQLAQL